MTIVQKFFSFKGRLRRRDYWLCNLGIFAATLAIGVPVMLSLQLDPRDPRISLLSLVCIWPWMAVLAKRIHDRDRTGWMVANYWAPWLISLGLSFVPQWGLGGFKIILDIGATVVAVWYLIEFGFLDGTPGKNAYGPSPKGSAPSETVAEVFG